ncbi:MAG: Gfo/Idh/MocA family oxidoreductase, partial [Rhodospirillales bacterium]|nr:Gfo/Idh/MocA family oxidoreductase [Rhodospirillales bacterium]
RHDLFGEPLHGFFENYAKDEQLGPSHWFWDAPRSGGIFIEHGVHFFDLFASWLGDGEVVAAQQVARPGAQREKPLIEQVQCTVRYAAGPLVNFFHGFTQAERMDRQEMRLLFERGSVRLFEWMPTELEIDCIADDATLAAIHGQLSGMLSNVQVEQVARYEGDACHVTSRHKSYHVDGRFILRADVGMSKGDLYGHVLRELLADQVRAIHDPSHPRRVSEVNGLTSLQLAEAAQCLADVSR